LAPIAVVLAVAACGSEGEGNAAGAGQGGPGGARQRGDSPIHVAVAPVQRGTVVSRYTTTATLEARNLALIEARVAGPVEKLLAEEGDEVAAGQELLHLEDTEARIELQKAEIALRQEHNMFERQKESLAKEVITQAEFDLAQTNRDAAEAERDLARETLSYTRVKAPFAGRIVARSVDLGQTVNVGDELFWIANFKPLLARVHVPAKEIGSLRVGQGVSIVLDSHRQELRGTVDLISPVIDPTTGTIKVTVKIDEYPEGTRPGDFAHVTIVTERHDDVLRVPNIAMFEDRGDQIVYVATDSVATRRVVQPGFIDEQYTEIVEGLTDAERVVVKGQRSLRDGARIEILEDAEGAAEATASSAADAAGGS
jgi:RND family efflux transporter MFP subunit